MKSNSSELSLQKPISFWNKQIRIRPKETLAGLAKAAVNGAKGDLDDVVENLADAFVDAEIENDIGQLAWALIYGALMRGVGNLLADGLDLFDYAQRHKRLDPPSRATLDELSGILEDHLNHCTVKLDQKFFDFPERFKLLDDFRPALAHWLEGIGLDKAESDSVSQRLNSQFPQALHEEWLRTPSRLQPLLEATQSPFANATERERQWKLYRTWLQAQVDQRMFGEAFGLRRVYVPMRAYCELPPESSHEYSGTQRLESAAQQHDRRPLVVDLHKHVKKWIVNYDPNDTVRVVSGGPGSGKSSFARMIADEVARDRRLKLLFIPLHLLSIRNDLVQAVGDFTRTNPWLQHNPLEGTGEPRLLVIFDGLDELSMQGGSAEEAARSFVDQVLFAAAQFSIQGLQRQFLITSRELAVQASSSRLRQPGQVLHVLPFVVDATKRHEYQNPTDLLKEDQRIAWWQRYGEASGQNYDEIPPQLRGENLIDITRQPLLNYLVALSHARGHIVFDASTNLNQIYSEMLVAVYERQYEGKGDRRHGSIRGIELSDYTRVLEEIALTIWHGSGQVASAAKIHAQCKASGLDRRLEVFERDAEQGVTRLLMAFYFRQAEYLGGDKTFEFTHKSFGEYLIACRLVRALTTIQKQLSEKSENPDFGWDARQALAHWSTICGSTAIDTYVDNFLRREISLRDVDICTEWQQLLCRLIESSVTYGLPMERLQLRTFRQAVENARNADEALLVAHAACADVTKLSQRIDWPNKTSFGSWFRRLQDQPSERAPNKRLLCVRSLRRLNLSKQALINLDLWAATLNGADLSAVDASGANFFGADLRDANLRSATLSESDLRSANLSGADLNSANLTDADLNSADLSGADLNKSDLTGANMNNAYLRGANMLDCMILDAKLGGLDETETNMESVNNFEHLNYERVDRVIWGNTQDAYEFWEETYDGDVGET